NTWYYKMYFEVLKVILSPRENYYIYVDIKDTRCHEGLKQLHEVLCSSIYDFSRIIIRRVQGIRAREVRIMQLTDLLIGAISCANKNRTTSSAKQQLIDRVKSRSGYKLTQTTLLRETKFNLLCWRPAETSANG